MFRKIFSFRQIAKRDSEQNKKMENEGGKIDDKSNENRNFLYYLYPIIKTKM